MTPTYLSLAAVAMRIANTMIARLMKHTDNNEYTYCIANGTLLTFPSDAPVKLREPFKIVYAAASADIMKALPEMRGMPASSRYPYALANLPRVCSFVADTMSADHVQFNDHSAISAENFILPVSAFFSTEIIENGWVGYVLGGAVVEYGPGEFEQYEVVRMMDDSIRLLITSTGSVASSVKTNSFASLLEIPSFLKTLNEADRELLIALFRDSGILPQEPTKEAA